MDNIEDYNSRFREMYERDSAESADEYREDFVEGDMDMAGGQIRFLDYSPMSPTHQ